MTETDIARIRATRDAFARNGEATASAFYAHLFAAHPDLRPMFPTDLRSQSRKLSATLTLAIDGLRDWTRFAPILDALARRHLGYGVEARHYAAVGTALLATLADLGVDPAGRAAWAKAFEKVSTRMIAAAYDGPGANAAGSLTV